MNERKHFLDWLRVIAFALLIVFHAGLLYSTWHYNLRSPRVFPSVEFALNALNPWRLALLFFISGVACRFLLEKMRPGTFALDRLRRLGPVILFGMLVIIPPQTYVELYDRGLTTTGYVEFWLTSYLLGDPYPGKILPTWDHLWFLVYLLTYTLGLAAIFRFLRSRPCPEDGPALSIGQLMGLPAIWLCVSNVLVSELNPVTHAFYNDWAAHVRWIGMFGAGVICARRSEFWEAARDWRVRLATLAGFFLAIQLSWLAYSKMGRVDPLWGGVIYSVVRGLYGWVAILALSGFAMKYLNRRTALLEYLNVATLPIYVLHQPVLLIAAYFLFPLQLPVVWEAILIVAITAGGAILIFELGIRRFGVARLLFGLKRLPEVRQGHASHGT